MTNPVIFDEQLRQYTISYEGIQFCWDEKPTDANLDTAKLLAVNYHKNIDTQRKSTRLNTRHSGESRIPSNA